VPIEAGPLPVSPGLELSKIPGEGAIILPLGELAERPGRTFSTVIQLRTVPSFDVQLVTSHFLVSPVFESSHGTVSCVHVGPSSAAIEGSEEPVSDANVSAAVAASNFNEDRLFIETSVAMASFKTRRMPSSPF
jgi:hypothetical protein